MPTVTASDSVKLYVEAHGDGFPLMLSPGYCQTHENFRPQVEPFVAAGARVVLWDYRGHGKSEAPEDPDAYFMERVLDDMDRVLEWAAPGRRAVLGGLSFGGLASLHFAIAHPERVRALLLFDSGPGFKNREAQAGWEAPGRPNRRPSREDGLRGLRRRPRLGDRHRTSTGSPGGSGSGSRHPGPESPRGRPLSAGASSVRRRG